MCLVGRPVFIDLRFSFQVAFSLFVTIQFKVAHLTFMYVTVVAHIQKFVYSRVIYSNFFCLLIPLLEQPGYWDCGSQKGDECFASTL